MTAEKRVWRGVTAALIASVVLVGFSDLVSGATQHNGSRFSSPRLYCAPDNASHFTYVTAQLSTEDFPPPAPPIAIGGSRPSSKSFIAGFEAHWVAVDLQARLNHPAPAIQLLT